MKIVYFYAKDGKKIGPLSREQLDDLHLTPDTLVWHYGLTGWIPYKNLPKQVVQPDESSPFGNFLTWLKSKKKESAPHAEVQPTPVVGTTKEDPITPTVSDVPAESVVKPVVDSETIAQIELQKEARRTKLFNGLKKSFIGLLILVALGGIIVGGVYAYDYYENTYLPEKRLNEACAELETKWAEADYTDKLVMALRILTIDAKWGYDNVPDSKINVQFAAPKRKAALELIENDAYRGSAASQFQMGQFYGYEDTYYVSINYTKAAYWWKEAAMNGNLSGYDNLGWAYENGKGVQKNMTKAIECYRISAEGNDDYGLFNMGRLYETGVKVPNGYHYEQYKVRMSHGGPKYSGDIFIRSAYIDNDWYEFYKHKVTDYKVILPKDINKARDYWKKAAALGNKDAKEKLQRIFE